MFIRKVKFLAIVKTMLEYRDTWIREREKNIEIEDELNTLRGVIASMKKENSYYDSINPN